MHVNFNKMETENKRPNKKVTEIQFVLNKNELLASENVSNVVGCVLPGLTDDKPVPGLD